MSEPESPHQLLTVAEQVELEKRLMQCESVRKFDDKGERESVAIADALGDLEKVFRKYLDQLLPRVLAATTCNALEDVLLDMRLEFQEVVFHLWYPKSFRVHLLGEDAQPPSIDTRLRP
jgi:DNA-binding IscR family transcriptional regulator